MIAALLVVAMVAAWQLYAEYGGVDDLILPAPSEIATALWDDRSLLWDNFVVTASEVALGIVAALVVGFACATAMHFSRTVRNATYPLLVASQAIPVVIVAPLLVVWLGFGIAPKVAIIALICFFPITVTTLDALGRVDRDTIKLLRTLDATRWSAFRHAEAPAAEYAGSSEGLGHLILQAIPQLETARAWAAVIVLAAFAVALFYALDWGQRRLVPWNRTERT
jgi:putative hydroxymethylpyrimidine transport system permease protein